MCVPTVKEMVTRTFQSTGGSELEGKKKSVGVARSIRFPPNLPGKSAERSTTTPGPHPRPQLKRLTRYGRRCGGPPSSGSCKEEVSMDVGLGRRRCLGRNIWRLAWPLLEVIWSKIPACGQPSCGLMKRSRSYFVIWVLNTSGRRKEQHTSQITLCPPSSMVVQT